VAGSAVQHRQGSRRRWTLPRGKVDGVLRCVIVLALLVVIFFSKTSGMAKPVVFGFNCDTGRFPLQQDQIKCIVVNNTTAES